MLHTIAFLPFFDYDLILSSVYPIMPCDDAQCRHSMGRQQIKNNTENYTNNLKMVRQLKESAMPKGALPCAL